MIQPNGLKRYIIVPLVISW